MRQSAISGFVLGIAEYKSNKANYREHKKRLQYEEDENGSTSI
jgi:hypothetical protein